MNGLSNTGLTEGLRKASRTTLFCTIIIFSILKGVITGSPAVEYISHYEPLYYDHQELHRQHHVIKRSADGVLRFDFDAYGRSFRARLKQDRTVFHPDLVIESSQEPIEFDTSRTYVGKLEGERSHVFGMVTSQGHFEGTIITQNGTYIIERSTFSFGEPQTFHSFVYRTSDVTYKHNSTFCKSEELYRRYRSNFQSHVTDYETVAHDWQEKYVYQEHGRRKRAVDPAKTVCTLYMQADHLYYNHFGGDKDTVIEKLTQHYQAVNTIYQSTGA